MAHKTAAELYQMLDDAKAQVELEANYYHYKRPKDLYTITDILIIEATDTVGICYRAEYPELKGITFIRPIEDFLAEVEVDGKMLKRFTKVAN